MFKRFYSIGISEYLGFIRAQVKNNVESSRDVTWHVRLVLNLILYQPKIQLCL